MKKKWDIRDEEKPIIEDSIAFGDWLHDHPLSTPRQREMIRVVQEVLALLPEYKPDFIGGYECTIESLNSNTKGVYRVWSIEFFNGTIEIGSIYTPYPEVSIPEQMHNEWWYEIEFGSRDRRNYGMDNWGKEIMKIESFLCDGYYLEIETSLGEDFAMSDKVLLDGKYIPRSDLIYN